MDKTTSPKRLAYCGCLYCGKIVGVNPEYCDFCNLSCQIKYQTGDYTDGYITSKQWEQNYYDSLPAFEEKLENWRKNWKERKFRKTNE